MGYEILRISEDSEEKRIKLRELRNWKKRKGEKSISIVRIYPFNKAIKSAAAN
jgi:hypothetical protein